MISFEAIYHNLIKEVIFYYINVEFIKINILQLYIFGLQFYLLIYLFGHIVWHAGS